MLDTLLIIGKTLREVGGAEGLRHHRYIKRGPIADEKTSIDYFVVTAKPDGSFDFATVRPLEDERIIRHDLLYLNYKTSDADSMKKYVFGDICRISQGKQPQTNFELGDPNSGAKGFQIDSFLRGEVDCSEFSDGIIRPFRDSFRRQREAMLQFLKDHPACFIHFDFAGRQWYEQDAAMQQIDAALMSQFAGPSDSGAGFVLKKSLYKTLADGPATAPGFSRNASHKSRLFGSQEDLSDLLYAIDYSRKALISKGNLKIIVLPRSETDAGQSRLTAEQIERFFEPRSLRKIADGEAAIGDSVAETMDFSDGDPMDDPEDIDESDVLIRPLRQADQSITKFDFIFSRAGSSASSPDVDLIELAGVERSRLSELEAQLRAIREPLESERKARFQFRKEPAPLHIMSSLQNIFADVTRDKKRYQAHLIKLLPKIYAGTYYDDPMLLPAFLQSVQASTRNDSSPNFSFLRYELLLLFGLQDVNQKGNRMNEIKNTQSYRAGTLLGAMARQFGGQDSPIKSFEKNYVGLLSRRVSNLNDVIRLQNDINQKLIMHDRARFTMKQSVQLSHLLTDFTSPYNSDYFAFGFFESYFERTRSPVFPVAGAEDSESNSTADSDADLTKDEA